MTTHHGSSRCFLFLQGPHGSFFPRLGEVLAAEGCGVRRINLNGGDRATWPSGDCYRGRDHRWPAYLAGYLARHRITDLIVFGDSRPAHASAIAAARVASVRIHVFEEGYIRPDWITLERDGVNGHSRLPRDPEWYVREARSLPPVPRHPPVPSYATARGWAAFFYHAEIAIQHWRFPFHRSHRDRDPLWEGLMFLRRSRRRARDAELSRDALARIAGSPYFLFPLQLNSDYQIRIHSHFGTMHAAVDTVFESFARAAPPGACLVVKEHPLESGLNPWREIVTAQAAAFGIADRVAFVDHGDLPALIAGARGTVVVNSTSGTLALAAGQPVKVLGTAVYDLPGLTDQQPLDGFWSNPQSSRAGLYDAFCRVLADRTLIYGAFLSNAGIDLLVTESARRLIAAAESEAMGACCNATRDLFDGPVPR